MNAPFEASETPEMPAETSNGSSMTNATFGAEIAEINTFCCQCGELIKDCACDESLSVIMPQGTESAMADNECLNHRFREPTTHQFRVTYYDYNTRGNCDLVLTSDGKYLLRDLRKQIRQRFTQHRRFMIARVVLMLGGAK